MNPVLELSAPPALDPVSVKIVRLPHAPAGLPDYATPGSAAMDLRAAIDEPLTLPPMSRVLVPTGWVILLPEGYEAQVRARSGLSARHGIALANGVGTIDADYRDELRVALINLGLEPFTIQPGDRVAQLLVAPVPRVVWAETAVVEAAPGRDGGFGSTGVG